MAASSMKNMVIHSLWIVLLAVSASASFAKTTYYKCPGEGNDGTTLYSETPCENRSVKAAKIGGADESGITPVEAPPTEVIRAARSAGAQKAIQLEEPRLENNTIYYNTDYHHTDYYDTSYYNSGVPGVKIECELAQKRLSDRVARMPTGNRVADPDFIEEEIRELIAERDQECHSY